MKDVKQKIGVQKHIRIDDTGISEQIDRILQLPEYKSFNKVINDALFYGLPVLTEKLFAGATLSKDENELPNKRKNDNEKDEEFYALIVKLLRETVLNVTINKSILSSIFNAKIIEYKGGKVHEDFSQGLMSDTPDYLNDFELNELKKLRR